MVTIKLSFRGAMGLLAAVGVSIAVLASRAADSANPKLRAAYQRLHFDLFYPPEVARHIEQKLQNVTDPVAALTELATDPTNEVRMLTALVLGELGESSGAKPLWKLLQDDSEKVRVTTAGAIARLKTYTPVVPNVTGLKDDRPDVRRLVAATLGKLRDHAAEPALAAALTDTNELVRTEVIRALSASGTTNSIPAIVERLDKDPSVLVRTAAAQGLGDTPLPAATTALIKAMDDNDWHVRAAAVRSLGWQSHNQMTKRAGLTEPILSKLKDDFALVRDRADDALTHVDDARTVMALVQAIISEDHDSRWHAARTILTTKAGAAVPLLMEHRNHPNPEVRQKVMEIFGELGGVNEVAAVVAALDDKDPNVALAAVNALRKMRTRVKPEIVVAKLTDTNPHIRAAAARALGDLGDRGVTTNLILLLRDDNSYVRSAAAQALGKLGDRSAISPLLQLISGEKPGGTTEIGVNDGFVIGANSKMFQDLQGDVLQQKKEAIRVLGNLRAVEAVQPIIKHGLRSEDADTRAVSAFSLGQIKDRAAVEPLQASVRDHYSKLVPKIDFGEVISTGGSTTDDQLRRSKERETKVRTSVIWALGQIADPAAIDILRRALDDENSFVRDAAAEALARIAERQEQEQTQHMAANPPPAPKTSAPTKP